MKTRTNSRTRRRSNSAESRSEDISMRAAFPWLCLSGSMLLASAPAAQSPPVKSGLWQMQSPRLIDGQKAPDPSAQMKNLPPDTRARMERMLKQQGVDVGGNGVSRI